MTIERLKCLECVAPHTHEARSTVTSLTTEDPSVFQYDSCVDVCLQPLAPLSLSTHLSTYLLFD